MIPYDLELYCTLELESSEIKTTKRLYEEIYENALLKWANKKEKWLSPVPHEVTEEPM